MVQLKLEPSVVAAMELPGVEVPDAASSFMLEFSPRGPHGTIWLQQDTCGGALIRFPFDAPCEPGQPEVEQTLSLYGVRPGDVLRSCVERLSKLPPVPVVWDDGASTALSLSIEAQPRAVCGGHDALFETGSPGYFEAPLGLRVTTSDQRVDLSVPANLVWYVYPEGRQDPGWDGLCALLSEHDLQADALSHAPALAGGTLPNNGRIRAALSATTKGDDAPSARLAFLEWGSTCSGEPKPLVALQTDDVPL